jgi:hypothetical protein
LSKSRQFSPKFYDDNGFKIIALTPGNPCFQRGGQAEVDEAEVHLFHAVHPQAQAVPQWARGQGSILQNSISAKNFSDKLSSPIIGRNSTQKIKYTFIYVHYGQ